MKKNSSPPTPATPPAEPAGLASTAPKPRAARALVPRSKVQKGRSARPPRSEYEALGLILASIEQPAIPSSLFQSILLEASSQHLHLSVAHLQVQKLVGRGNHRSILEEMCADGLLIYHPGGREPILEKHVQSHGVPAVWLDSPGSAWGVRPDDHHAAYEATRQLLTRGHRRVALVMPENWSHSHLELRIRGYEEAMREAGEETLLFTCDNPVPAADWRVEAAQWLGQAERPTAVLAYSPEIAFELYAAAKELGLQVPKDLSLVAFHDVALNLFGVKLSTVKIPYERMGQAAVKMLIKRISRPNAAIQEVTVPFEWHEGATVAPPLPLLRSRAATKHFVE